LNLLIPRSGSLGRVSKDGALWLETREGALLTMRNVESLQMNHDAYDDNYIRAILNGVKSIAMVGASPVNVRPSYFAFKYLAQRGYDMIPVNPGHVGKSLLGKRSLRRCSKLAAPSTWSTSSGIPATSCRQSRKR